MQRQSRWYARQTHSLADAHGQLLCRLSAGSHAGWALAAAACVAMRQCCHLLPLSVTRTLLPCCRPDRHRSVRRPCLRPRFAAHCEADERGGSRCRRRRSCSTCTCGSLQPHQHQCALCMAGRGCLHSRHSTRSGCRPCGPCAGSAAHPQRDSGGARGWALWHGCTRCSGWVGSGPASAFQR